MINILLVEDEEILGHLIREVLLNEPDFAIDWVKDGASAIKCILEKSPDICILDIMLPELDGLAVAKEVRKIYPDLPIIFLTAKSSVSDVVKGFKAGGNDYLRKPFSIKELVLRVKALLYHRSISATKELNNNQTVMIGHYCFSALTQTLNFNEIKYVLTSRETEILQELMLYRNELVYKKDILTKIWGVDSIFASRNMDVYIGRLRKYLVHDPSVSIINIRGYGYKLVSDTNS